MATPRGAACCASLLLVCLAVSGLHHTRAQVVLAAQTLLSAPEQQQQSAAAVVPESQAVVPGAARDAAVPAAASADAAVTTVRVRRHTRAEAASALQRARSWRPMLNAHSNSSSAIPGPDGSSGGGFVPGAICGGNSLVQDSSISNCRIVIGFGSSSFTCSAFKIGDRLLGTAGHCVYQKPNGGWATSVDVYCTGARTCGVARTTYATHITTTPTWMASETTIPTAWDGAVVKTATSLPGSTFPLAQYAGPGQYTVKLTGYPAQSGDPGCNTDAFAGACAQFSSTDTMQAPGSGMYTSPNLDLCSGHSGSGVATADGSRYITAVVSGASFSPCANYFVPQVNSDRVDKNCEQQPAGGVSLACLAAKLPA